MTSGWIDFQQMVAQYPGLDLLAQDSTTLYAPSGSLTLPVTKNYGGLLIKVQPALACDFDVIVQDQRAAFPTWRQRKTTPANQRPISYAFPYPFGPNSQPQILFTSSVNQTSNSSVWVWGVGAPTPSTHGTKLVRPDGIAVPNGSKGASLTLATGSGTVINAPGAGLSLLIYMLNHASNGVNSSVIGTVGGVAVNLSNIFTAQGVSFNVPIPLGGVLLDTNTALTMGAGAGIQQANVLYDVILSPTSPG